MTLAEKIAHINGLPLSEERKQTLREAAARNNKRGPYACRGLTKDRKAYAAAYYRQRVDSGKCHCCGKMNKDRAGKVTCGKCLTKLKNKKDQRA
jgi:hypothetical protein